MAFFDLVVQTGASLHPDGEPSDFISEYTGFIRCTNDRTGKVHRAGKVHAYRIHADLALEHGESLFDVCDAHSQGLHECYSLLYEPDTDCLRPFFTAKFDAVEPDCLVLDYIIVHPKWRPGVLRRTTWPGS